MSHPDSRSQNSHAERESVDALRSRLRRVEALGRRQRAFAQLGVFLDALPEESQDSDALARRFVAVLREQMGISRVALYTLDDSTGVFQDTHDARAARRFAAGESTANLTVVSPDTASEPWVEKLRAQAQTPHLMWVWDNRFEWALLLGCREGDPGGAAFEAEEHLAALSALSLLHTLEHRRQNARAILASADLFLELGPNPRANIQAIVERARALVGGTASLYNRLDQRDNSLVVWAGDHLPPDLPDRDAASGHICYEATIKEHDRTIALGDLDHTVYAQSDPAVVNYGLKAYLGHPVHLGKRAIGSLAVVYDATQDFLPEEEAIIQTLARALSLEEERLAALQKLQRVNHVLGAIRSVNHLIVQEQDRDRLLEQACQLLVETQGYLEARVILESDDEADQIFEASVHGLHTAPVTGEPHCVRDHLVDDVYIASESTQTCLRCPVRQRQISGHCIVQAIAYKGERFGWLNLISPSRVAREVGEVEWLREIASDLGYALRSMKMDAALQASEDKYRLIVEHAHDAILLLDGMRIVDCNRRCADIFGFDEAAELLGMSLLDISAAIQADGRPSDLLLTDYLKAVDEGEMQIFEWTCHSRQNSRIQTQVHLSALPIAGEQPYIQAILRDISSQKAIESQLRARIDELEQFHDLTVGRELQMRDLKEQINSLHREIGRPPPYDFDGLERVAQGLDEDSLLTDVWSELTATHDALEEP